ncbi:hypothetical protein NPX13_g105 [Xylaria arbuscula]|uniref:Uncharacterized protein n=1 Tax=Xylaria arbuscula TaxID=114810 RepID=A0A9W8TQU0_9PEZI|nr:hypothetical protein NPX13_g105 [Xylaria arbuscula]
MPKRGEQQSDPLDLPADDVDCVIVVVRMLMSLGFLPEHKYRDAAIIKCARHDFGWRKDADYHVKCMLIQKLFPDLLSGRLDSFSLGDKFSFKNLMRHPGIAQIIFASPAFSFRYYRLPLNVPASEINVNYEPVESCSKQIHWDGNLDLGPVIKREVYDSELIAIVPKFISVYFTPDQYRLEPELEVEKFGFSMPTKRYERNGVIRYTLSRVTYTLRVAVKLSPFQSPANPTEVRVYDANFQVIKPSPHGEEQARPDSEWELGDPDYHYMLFYSKRDPPKKEVDTDVLIFSWGKGAVLTLSY